MIICDHFDAIKNKIDIRKESILAGESLNDDKWDDIFERLNESESENAIEILSDEDRHTLNVLREMQLNKIEQVKERHLANLKFDENEYLLKWSHVIDNVELTFEKKVELIKEELIEQDCVLINDKEYLSKISLWVMPWYYNKIHLDFLK